MSDLRRIQEKFNQLSASEKEALLKDVYLFSKDTKLFLEGRLLGTGGVEFIRRMEKETITKVYRKGMPSTPNGRIVNSIIQKARKSGVDTATMLELQKLAYRGFIEFLNEYGGGPENFDTMACQHLATYLSLVKLQINDPAVQRKMFEEVEKYLYQKDNMSTDTLYDTYELITGIKVRRKY